MTSSPGNVTWRGLVKLHKHTDPSIHGCKFYIIFSMTVHTKEITQDTWWWLKYMCTQKLSILQVK